MDQVTKLFSSGAAEALLGDEYVEYSELISASDRNFWSLLCEKDFVRLNKLQKCSLGEGNFHDSDSDVGSSKNLDSSDDEESDNILGGGRQGGRQHKEKEEDDDDDFDHNAFME